MINTKKVLRLARKLQKKAANGRKRITSSKTRIMVGAKKPFGVDKGHFAIYTTDMRRFVIPLAYLSNSIFIELLKMSEEEFGLSSDGPIQFPCDSVFMNYIVLLVQQGLAKDLEKAVLNSPKKYHCSSDSTTFFFHEGHADEQTLVCGF